MENQKVVFVNFVELVVVLEHLFSQAGPEIPNFCRNIDYCSPNKLSRKLFLMVEIFDKSGLAGVPVARPRVRRRIALEVAE